MAFLDPEITSHLCGQVALRENNAPVAESSKISGGFVKAFIIIA